MSRTPTPIATILPLLNEDVKLYSFDDKSHKSMDSLPKGTSSIFGVYQNFLNALVGAGILGIPSVYATCGILGGILLMIIFAFLSSYTMTLLIKTAQTYQVWEYEQLGNVSFGSFGYILVSATLFLLDFGSCTNYLIILGDASFKVLQIWSFDSLFDRQIIIILVSMVLIFPPCLLRDISVYQKCSFVKIIAVILVISVVFCQWIMYKYAHNFTSLPSETETIFFEISGFPAAIGIISYCFVAHDTAFLYYNTLHNPTTLRWNKTVLLSIGSAMFLSLILSIPAYLTFGSSVKGNVLNNYPIHELSMIITRIIYVIMMALTFPTAFFVVRHVVYASIQRLISFVKIQRYKRNRKSCVINNNDDFEEDIANYSMHLFQREYNVKNSPLWQHVMITSILFSIPLTLSMFIVDLGAAMSIIGALSSVNLAFVFPCVAHIKQSKYGFWSYITEATTKGKINAFAAIYPPLLLAMLGGFIAVYGVISALRTV